MKSLLFVAVISSSALGSSYQMFCMNPEGTVSHKDGMSIKETVVTKRQYVNGNIRDEKIQLSSPIIQFSNRQTISVTDRCDPAFSVFYRTILEYRKAHITDSSLTFPSETLGLDSETGWVVTDLLCQTFINSVQACNSPAQEPPS